MTRRLAHPLVVIALAALVLFGTRIAFAQTGGAAMAARAMAARAIPRGATLTADDITYADSATLGDTGAVRPGWVARRVIAAGEALRQPAVQPPIIVEANQAVDLEWSDGAVRIMVRGTAARNGAAGERIPVRLANGKRAEGVVIAPGRIRLN